MLTSVAVGVASLHKAQNDPPSRVPISRTTVGCRSDTSREKAANSPTFWIAPCALAPKASQVARIPDLRTLRHTIRMRQSIGAHESTRRESQEQLVLELALEFECAPQEARDELGCAELERLWRRLSLFALCELCIAARFRVSAAPPARSTTVNVPISRRARSTAARPARTTPSRPSMVSFDVPGDLSVVGFDDIEVASYAGLTTVRQPLFESGHRGCELLLQALAGEALAVRTETMRLELVARGTTAPPKTA
jgi:Periplasmic binding protein-like domain